MVRLINLTDPPTPNEPDTYNNVLATDESGEDHVSNPNLNTFSAALACYPIASQLARYLDLNTLHELSRTCRQFRANLLQYRKLLIQQALRCAYENPTSGQRLGNAPGHSVWTAYGRDGMKIGRLTSGKVGACASDLVGECHKCGVAVCRNCIIKAPPQAAVKGRHRRLCRTCLKAPLDALTQVARLSDEGETDRATSQKSVAYSRLPCACFDGVWICQPCGQSLRPADTTYLRGWTWRTRYSHCGGLGAGLGEGNEGVECGRTRDCLAATAVEKDVECDAGELAALEAEMAKAEMEGRHLDGSSYLTQEIVGIGGRVKKKVKKRVLVGAVVKEHEDERESERFLEREQTGAARSWCAWCDRVVAAQSDLDAALTVGEVLASSAS